MGNKTMGHILLVLSLEPKKISDWSEMARTLIKSGGHQKMKRTHSEICKTPLHK
jgi:hypothetical protein